MAIQPHSSSRRNLPPNVIQKPPQVLRWLYGSDDDSGIEQDIRIEQMEVQDISFKQVEDQDVGVKQAQCKCKCKCKCRIGTRVVQGQSASAGSGS